MTYVSPNFHTKRALRESFQSGGNIQVYEPGYRFGDIPRNGTVYLEGPHYPEAHTWYASGIMKDGKLIAIT